MTQMGRIYKGLSLAPEDLLGQVKDGIVHRAASLTADSIVGRVLPEGGDVYLVVNGTVARADNTIGRVSAGSAKWGIERGGPLAVHARDGVISRDLHGDEILARFENLNADVAAGAAMLLLRDTGALDHVDTSAVVPTEKPDSPQRATAKITMGQYVTFLLVVSIVAVVGQKLWHLISGAAPDVASVATNDFREVASNPAAYVGKVFGCDLLDTVPPVTDGFVDSPALQQLGVPSGSGMGVLTCRAYPGSSTPLTLPIWVTPAVMARYNGLRAGAVVPVRLLDNAASTNDHGMPWAIME